MEGALAWRRRAFLVWGIPALLLTLSVDTVADVFDQKSNPDAITVGAWLFLAVDLVVLSRVLFGAPQVRKMRQRLAERKGSASIEALGKALSFLAVSLLGAPILMGLVLVSMSGDAWRLYVFVPISLVGGVVLWRQIEAALRQLDSSAGGST
jgi:hypothetical protein